MTQMSLLRSSAWLTKILSLTAQAFRILVALKNPCLATRAYSTNEASVVHFADARRCFDTPAPGVPTDHRY